MQALRSCVCKQSSQAREETTVTHPQQAARRLPAVFLAARLAARLAAWLVASLWRLRRGLGGFEEGPGGLQDKSRIENCNRDVEGTGRRSHAPRGQRLQPAHAASACASFSATVAIRAATKISLGKTRARGEGDCRLPAKVLITLVRHPRCSPVDQGAVVRVISRWKGKG